MSTSNGIKSKDNVRDFGEVFTPDSIVNDMLDLVDNALKEDNTSPEDYLAKTYLEPSCGDGQFLVRILDRKLAAIVENVPKEDWALAVVKALTTIYGVDIQQVNVDASKKRMLDLLKTGDIKTFDLPNKVIREFTKIDLQWTPEYERVVQYILDKNIQCGDTLNKSGNKEVIITEFKWDGTKVKQQGYYLSNLDMLVSSRFVDFTEYTQLGLNEEDTEEEEFDIDDF